MLELMDYSLQQYTPIREGVIQLITDPEARRGHWDIITLMNSGFGRSTDDPTLVSLARDIHNLVARQLAEMQSQLKFQQLLCTLVVLGTTCMGTVPNGPDKVSL